MKSFMVITEDFASKYTFVHLDGISQQWDVLIVFVTTLATIPYPTRTDGFGISLNNTILLELNSITIY